MAWAGICSCQTVCALNSKGTYQEQSEALMLKATVAAEASNRKKNPTPTHQPVSATPAPISTSVIFKIAYQDCITLNYLNES
jgi:hypothetical protein